MKSPLFIIGGFLCMELDKKRKHKIIAKEIVSVSKERKNNYLKDHLEWIKRQLDYATFANEYKMRLEVKKGEIYEIDWGMNVNAEFSNRHFGVVLKDSNEYNPLVLMCPLKTNKYGAHPASDIDLGYVKQLYSENKTLAIVNQIRSVDKMRIYSKNAIGDCDVSEDEIPILEDEKVNLILTAYFNYIFGDNLK